MRLAGTAAALIAWSALTVGAARAADVAAEPDITGEWVANLELSDDADKAIEKAIRKAGGRPDTGGKRGRARYRGGPADQELYDRMTWDDVLTIRRTAPEFRFTYADNFSRVFYTDGRSRTVSATGTASGDNLDFSFGSWGGNTLNVEARVRDGGWTKERYTLQTSETGTQQLRVEFELAPLGFREPVRFVRIFDRPGSQKPKRTR